MLSLKCRARQLQRKQTFCRRLSKYRVRLPKNRRLRRQERSGIRNSRVRGFHDWFRSSYHAQSFTGSCRARSREQRHRNPSLDRNRGKSGRTSDGSRRRRYRRTLEGRPPRRPEGRHRYPCQGLHRGPQSRFRSASASERDAAKIEATSAGSRRSTMAWPVLMMPVRSIKPLREAGTLN